VPALAQTCPQLVVARMTVGVGEAGGVPPCCAIITHHYPAGLRGTALGFFDLGLPLWAALGIGLAASNAAAFNWRYASFVLISVFVNMLFLFLA